VSRKANLAVVAVVAIGAFAATLGAPEPVEAGTCQPVKAKGRAKDAATATTRAQVELIQRAARLGGNISQTSTNCVPGPTGVVCKMSAVACPK
jgi:hypothetical protein